MRRVAIPKRESAVSVYEKKGGVSWHTPGAIGGRFSNGQRNKKNNEEESEEKQKSKARKARKRTERYQEITFLEGENGRFQSTIDGKSTFGKRFCCIHAAPIKNQTKLRTASGKREKNDSTVGE